MSGIKISRSAAAVVHAEGPGGGDSATLCGKGADYIHGVDEDPTCKSCVKVLARQEAAARDTLQAARNGMASATAAEYAERQRSWGGIDGADKILRDMRVAAEIASDGILADWLTEVLVELESLAVADAEGQRIARDMARAAEGLSAGYLATVPAGATLVTGHEAESHSRRGRECRFCHQPVVEHESVKITDGVAVAWWTGTVVDPSAVLNAERVATVEARREAARTETPVKTDADWAEDLRRAAIRDGVYRHIMGQPPVNPAIYGSDQVAALAHVHAWLTGHWGCECTGCGPNGGKYGGKLVYLLTSVSVADDTAARADIAPTAVSSAPESPSDQTGGEAGSVDSGAVARCLRCDINEHDKCRVIVVPSLVKARIVYCTCSCRTKSELHPESPITGDDLSMIDDADDLGRFIAAGRQSLTGTAWRVRPGASKRKIHGGR